MERLRLIVMPKTREKSVDETMKLVLGDQYGDSFMMFNTSFSYEVLDNFEFFRDKYKNLRDYNKKFDMLLGFTHAIKRFDVWVHDHEVGWGGEKMTSSLAHMWKNLLAKPDDELGIDSEFTSPGVICLLEQFRELVEDTHTYDDPPMKFKFH